MRPVAVRAGRALVGGAVRPEVVDAPAVLLERHDVTAAAKLVDPLAGERGLRIPVPADVMAAVAGNAGRGDGQSGDDQRVRVLVAG